MTTNEAFHTQKKIGDVAERTVQGIYRANGYMIIGADVRARWDFAVFKASVAAMLEVKNEEAYASSGRICIELFQGEDRRVSGMLLSESTFCIHYLGKVSVIIRTQPFRLWLDSVRTKLNFRPFGKADNGNGGYLLPRKRLPESDWGLEVPTDQLPMAMLELGRRPVNFPIAA